MLAASTIAMADEPAPPPAEAAPPVEAAPVPEPAPAPEPTPAPAPEPVATVTATPTPTPKKPFVDDYYSRQRGVGIFHKSRLTLGGMTGTVPNFVEDMAPATPGETKGVFVGSLGLEGSLLALPSSYGNFHGIEFSTGLRSTPIDYWLQLGTSVTLFNLGRGGIGSIRVGGGFGAGFNLAHGYAYLRGRVAIVVVPAKVDIEINASWTPTSASTHNYDEQQYRVSAWYRPGKSKRAFEVFVESLRRVDDSADEKRELEGVGGGIGMTLF